MRLLATVWCFAVAFSAALAATHGAPATAIRAETPPTIDGDLGDSIWRDAAFITEFRQQQPVEGGVPTRRTEVAFAYDDDALYVAARMFADTRTELEAPMTRRDETGAAERIIVSVDTFRDRRTAQSFAVTAAGVRADWFHPDDAPFPRDFSFNPVWQAATRIAPDRWTAEMRIPFSQIRFPSQTKQIWGLNINRFIPQKNEDIYWKVVPKDATAWSSGFGKFEGIRASQRPIRVELLPYVAADTTVLSDSLVDPADPFAEQLDGSARVGLDAKIGLGPNLTIDATINPDFGQVELDPAVVNLSGFETVFDERRPFFVEGAQLLAAPGRTYFFSRRIGTAPRGDADGDFVDRPTSTPIFGAAKVTGRIPSRLSIGALAAVTGSAKATVFDAASGTESQVAVEPLSAFAVARVEQEVGESSSRIGAIVTATARDLDGDGPLSQQFTRFSSSGGLDWGLRLVGGRYEIGGNLGYSAIAGEAPAIAAIAQSTAHLFQRPDADHVELDLNKTSMVGWNGRLGGAKRSGKWRWDAGAVAESPGFELNDLGQLSSADDIAIFGTAAYNESEPDGWFHRWDAGLSAAQEWNFGFDRNPASLTGFASVTLPSFWRLRARSRLGTPGKDDAPTRGGALTGIGWSTSGDVGLSSSGASRTQWEGEIEWDVSETGPTGIIVEGAITTRPVDRLEVRVGPRFFRRSDNRQFIETIDGSGGPTFGSRHIFSTIERQELSLEARLRVAFAPDLTLELFAQPFVSAGAFTSFGELAAPGSRDRRDYGTDGTSIATADGTHTVTDGANTFSFERPDFTALSLRSTVVLRWEPLPGSTLFVVWQQSREDDLDRSRRGLAPAGDAFTAPARQTFAIKFSYWWSAL